MKNEVGARHLTKEKTRKLYDYYTCDYCKEEIEITEKWEDKTGGIINIPSIVTGLDKPVCLVLCNKCVKPVLKEFEEKRTTEFEKNNYNHIPRID